MKLPPPGHAGKSVRVGNDYGQRGTGSNVRETDQLPEFQRLYRVYKRWRGLRAEDRLTPVDVNHMVNLALRAYALSMKYGVYERAHMIANKYLPDLPGVHEESVRKKWEESLIALYEQRLEESKKVLELSTSDRISVDWIMEGFELEPVIMWHNAASSDDWEIAHQLLQDDFSQKRRKQTVIAYYRLLLERGDIDQASELVDTYDFLRG